MTPVLSNDERDALTKEHSDAAFSTVGYFDGEEMQWASFDRKGLRSLFDAVEAAVLAALAARAGDLPEMPEPKAVRVIDSNGDEGGFAYYGYTVEQMQQYARYHGVGVLALHCYTLNRLIAMGHYTAVMEAMEYAKKQQPPKETR
jgi:hypothetical protein